MSAMTVGEAIRRCEALTHPRWPALPARWPAVKAAAFFGTHCASDVPSSRASPRDSLGTGGLLFPNGRYLNIDSIGHHEFAARVLLRNIVMFELDENCGTGSGQGLWTLLNLRVACIRSLRGEIDVACNVRLTRPQLLTILRATRDGRTITFDLGVAASLPGTIGESGDGDFVHFIDRHDAFFGRTRSRMR